MRLAVYSGLVAAFSTVLIYGPNYFMLQLLAAEDSALILRTLGYGATVKVVAGSVFLAGFQLTRECAAIQAFVPLSVAFAFLPRLRNTQRLLVVLAVFSSIYLANLARIVLELVIFAQGILPWQSVHDYFGFGFSMAAVVMTLFFVGKLTGLNSIDIIVSKFTQ